MLALKSGGQFEALIGKLEKQEGFTLTQVDNLSATLAELNRGDYRFFLSRMRSLGEGAAPLLRRLNRMAPLTDLIVMVDSPEELSGVAVDQLISEETTLAEMITAVREAVELRMLLDKIGMFGHSRNLRDAARRIQQVAPTDISVLISGPSGTGKELVARALHDNSPRCKAEFVSINCASIPESLLESELFGHERGAFTGADSARPGLFVQADKGTLFLDEIGEMHINLQAKLLRALETKSFLPLGARKPVKVDVRVVAATNRNLQQLVQEGGFRTDLYYRIGVIDFTMQRLAERPEDVLPIIARYLGQARAEINFSPDATSLLLDYGWPGNVRELTNFLQRLLLTSPKGEVSKETVASILERHGSREEHLPVATNVRPEESGFRLVYQALLNLADEVAGLKRMLGEHLAGQRSESEGAVAAMSESGELEAMEEKLIHEALRRHGGNRKQAASFLGIGERTLYRKLKKYGIS